MEPVSTSSDEHLPKQYPSKIKLAAFPRWAKGSREAASEGPAVRKTHPGIGYFVKKCPFQKYYFFLIWIKFQKQLLIRRDSTSICPSGLSKCPFVEVKSQEQFLFNSFHFKSFQISNFLIFHNFLLKFLNTFHTNTWWSVVQY